MPFFALALASWSKSRGSPHPCPVKGLRLSPLASIEVCVCDSVSQLAAVGSDLPRDSSQAACTSFNSLLHVLIRAECAKTQPRSLASFSGSTNHSLAGGQSLFSQVLGQSAECRHYHTHTLDSGLELVVGPMERWLAPSAMYLYARVKCHTKHSVSVVNSYHGPFSFT